MLPVHITQLMTILLISKAVFTKCHTVHTSSFIPRSSKDRAVRDEDRSRGESLKTNHRSKDCLARVSYFQKDAQEHTKSLTFNTTRLQRVQSTSYSRKPRRVAEKGPPDMTGCKIKVRRSPRNPHIGYRGDLQTVIRPLIASDSQKHDQEKLYDIFLASVAASPYDLHSSNDLLYENNARRLASPEETYKIVLFPDKIIDFSSRLRKNKTRWVLKYNHFPVGVPTSEENGATRLTTSGMKLNLAVRSINASVLSPAKVQIRVHIRHLREKVLLSSTKKDLTQSTQLLHLDFDPDAVQQFMNTISTFSHKVALKITCRLKGKGKCDIIGHVDHYRRLSQKYERSLQKRQALSHRPYLEITYESLG